jgi:hypothetical protein
MNINRLLMTIMASFEVALVCRGLHDYQAQCHIEKERTCGGVDDSRFSDAGGASSAPQVTLRNCGDD